MRWFSRSHRCITYNARGYPPSDVPEDPDEYGWQFSVADLLAVLDGLSIDVAHVVGLSMGGYAVLQFALAHPERVSAVVAAATGSGSAPGDRDTWPTVAAGIAESFLTRGMPAMADEIGHSPDAHPAPAQGPAGVAGVHGPPRRALAAGDGQHDGPLPGPAPVAVRLPGRLRGDDGARAAGPRRRGRAVPGDEPDAQAGHPDRRAVGPPAHRPRHQPRGAGGVQRHGRVVLRRRRARGRERGDRTCRWPASRSST